MRVLGVTGGSGAGKSALTGMLRGFGAGVVDADACNRAIVAPGWRWPADEILDWSYRRYQWIPDFGRTDVPPFEQIREAWPGTIRADGTLDRKALGAIVFPDPRQRLRLERILAYPLAIEIDRGLKAIASGQFPYAVLDDPYLVPARHTWFVERVAIVAARYETRLERIIAREPGLTRDVARARLDSQAYPDALLAEISRFGLPCEIVRNDGPEEDLLSQAACLHADMLLTTRYGSGTLGSSLRRRSPKWSTTSRPS